MSYGYYISAEGANVQSSRLDVIANNLANVDTIGFKRDLAVFQARYAEAVSKGLVMPGAGAKEDVGGGTLFRQTKTDFSQGKVKETGDPSNLAILGDGFFVVKKGDEKLLTRAGNFQLTPRGELITPQGYSVLDESRVPVVVNPQQHWEIDGAGRLLQGDTAIELAMVKPKSNQDLVKTGENLFRSLSATTALVPAERSVASGYLEHSTVEPTLEMTALIEASRFFEINLSMMKTQDDTLGALVNRVLKV
ncbi:MAG: flagellar hook-basal body protein [Thermoguttaceae bacterium]